MILGSTELVKSNLPLATLLSPQQKVVMDKVLANAGIAEDSEAVRQLDFELIKSLHKQHDLPVIEKLYTHLERKNNLNANDGFNELTLTPDSAIVMIDELIAEEKANGSEYPPAGSYKNYLSDLAKETRKREVLSITSELDSFLKKADRYSIKENPKADKIREFLSEYLVEKRRAVVPHYDTSALEKWLKNFIAQKAKAYELSADFVNEPKNSTEREMRNLVWALRGPIGVLSSPESIGLYEVTEHSTLSAELASQMRLLKREAKKNTISNYLYDLILPPYEKLIKECLASPTKKELGGLFHGSAKQFSKFNNRKVGDGGYNGDNPLGWGFYFAGSRDSAVFYAIRNQQIKINYKGKKYNSSNYEELADNGIDNPELMNYLDAINYPDDETAIGTSKQKILEDIDAEINGNGNTADRINLLQEAKEFIKKHVDIDKYIYRVTLKKDKPHDFLEWYKPLKVWQTDKIKSATQKSKYNFDGFDFNLRNGLRMYEELQAVIGTDKSTSQFLFKAGIDGVRAYDEQYETETYVAFDDSIITIDEVEKLATGGTLKKRLKDGEAIITQSGAKFYLNVIPLAEQNKKGKLTEHEKCRKNISLFLRKNIQNPNDVIAELNGWFADIKQPREQQVRDAMILSIDDDYKLKSGGDNNSEHIYSSSLTWMQADPKTGEDYSPVIVKRYSTKFENILIKIEDLRDLVAATLTEFENREKQLDDLNWAVHNFAFGLRLGKINNGTKQEPFTEEWRNLLLGIMRKNDDGDDVKEAVEKAVGKLDFDIEMFESGRNGILDDELDRVDKKKTAEAVTLLKEKKSAYEHLLSIYNQKTDNQKPESAQVPSNPQLDYEILEIREILPAEKAENSFIQGYNYEVKVSIAESLGEMGEYREMVYENYPTTAEIEADITDEYKALIAEFEEDNYLGAREQNMLFAAQKALGLAENEPDADAAALQEQIDIVESSLQYLAGAEKEEMEEYIKTMHAALQYLEPAEMKKGGAVHHDREVWEKTFEELKAHVLVPGVTMPEESLRKAHKEKVQRQLPNEFAHSDESRQGGFLHEIETGKMTVNRAIEIIESAGLDVPKEISDIKEPKPQKEKKRVGSDPKNTKVLTAYEAAKDLIRAYVVRGDSYADIKRGGLSSSSNTYWAGIGGHTKGRKISGDKILVSKLNGKDVEEIFSLQKIYNEIKETEDCHVCNAGNSETVIELEELLAGAPKLVQDESVLDMTGLEYQNNANIVSDWYYIRAEEYTPHIAELKKKMAATGARSPEKKELKAEIENLEGKKELIMSVRDGQWIEQNEAIDRILLKLTLDNGLLTKAEIEANDGEAWSSIVTDFWQVLTERPGIEVYYNNTLLQIWFMVVEDYRISQRITLGNDFAVPVKYSAAMGKEIAMPVHGLVAHIWQMPGKPIISFAGYNTKPFAGFLPCWLIEVNSTKLLTTEQINIAFDTRITVHIKDNTTCLLLPYQIGPGDATNAYCIFESFRLQLIELAATPEKFKPLPDAEAAVVIKLEVLLNLLRQSTAEQLALLNAIDDKTSYTEQQLVKYFTGRPAKTKFTGDVRTGYSTKTHQSAASAYEIGSHHTYKNAEIAYRNKRYSIVKGEKVIASGLTPAELVKMIFDGYLRVFISDTNTPYNATHQEEIEGVSKGKLFMVTYVDGSKGTWRGDTKEHVKMLTRTETNLGWIPAVKKIEEIPDDSNESGNKEEIPTVPDNEHANIGWLEFKVPSEQWGTTICSITNFKRAIESGFCSCGDGSNYALSAHEIAQLQDILETGNTDSFVPTASLPFPNNLIALMKPDGNRLLLPTTVRLSASDYAKVRAVLQTAGGKYVKNSFEFPEPAADVYSRILNGEEYALKKKYQYFGTPATLADYMVELADIKCNKDQSFLEPSAGEGAIIDAIHRKCPNVTVDYCEIWEQNLAVLKKKKNVSFMCSDFTETRILSPKPLYDRIIANPPFSKNRDVEHIRLMYDLLAKAGKLVSVSSKHWQFAKDNKSVQFREWINQLGAKIIEIEPGRFKESGTMMGTLIIVIDK